jgi:DNA-binding transcriptional MerR regulator
VRELPRKQFYKLSEVCRVTDTQPYVLRFWESEFPQLNPDKSTGGQRMYRQRDIDLVQRIKALLYEEECTLDGARRKLADEWDTGRRPKRASAREAKPAPRGATRQSGAPREERRTAVSTPRRKLTEPPPEPVEVDSVPRQRYEDAVEEVEHLRLALKEAENALHRAEAVADESQAAAQAERERAEKALAHMERLLELLS